MKLWIPAALVSICGIVAAVENANTPHDSAPEANRELDLAEVQDPGADQVHEQVQRELERAQREVEAAMREAQQTREHAVREAEQAHESARAHAERSHEQAIRQAERASEQAVRQAERASEHALRQAEQAMRQVERSEREFERAMQDSKGQTRGRSARPDARAEADAREAYEAAMGQWRSSSQRAEADERGAATGMRRQLGRGARAPRADSDAIKDLEERVSELERRLGIIPSGVPLPSAQPRGVRGVRAPRAPRAPRAVRVPLPSRPQAPRNSSARVKVTAPSTDCCQEDATLILPHGATVLRLDDLEDQLATLPGSISIDLGQLEQQLAALEELDFTAQESELLRVHLEALEELEGLEWTAISGEMAEGFPFATTGACPGCGDEDCSNCSDDDDCDKCDEDDDCCEVEVVFSDGFGSETMVLGEGFGSKTMVFSGGFGSEATVECEEAVECEVVECEEIEECEEGEGDVSSFEFDFGRFGENGEVEPTAPEAAPEPEAPVSTHAPSLVRLWPGAQQDPALKPLWVSSPAVAPAASPAAPSPLMRELTEIVVGMRGEVADLRETLRSLRAEVQRAEHRDFDGQL